MFGILEFNPIRLPHIRNSSIANSKEKLLSLRTLKHDFSGSVLHCSVVGSSRAYPFIVRFVACEIK